MEDVQNGFSLGLCITNGIGRANRNLVLFRSARCPIDPRAIFAVFVPVNGNARSLPERGLQHLDGFVRLAWMHERPEPSGMRTQALEWKTGVEIARKPVLLLFLLLGFPLLV